MGADWLTGLADVAMFSVTSPMPEEWELREHARQIARGDVGAAEEDLIAAHRDAVRRRQGAKARIALALLSLAKTWRWNLYPGGAGAGSIELATRWNPQAELEAIQAELTRARDLPGAGSTWTAVSWLQFLTNLQPARAVLRDSAGHPHRELMLGVQLQMCQGALHDAVKIGPPAEAFVHRTLAELAALGGRTEEASSLLDQAMSICEQASDPAGMAGCRALRADWYFGGSGGLVRNLAISEAAFPTSELLWLVEEREGATGQADCNRAADELARAFALYRDAGATAGCALVRVRQGFLARARGDLDGQLTHIDEAIELAEGEGPSFHLHLARAHRALAGLERGSFPADATIARSIGAWGAGEGSFSYALGLGLMFTRAGRQAMLRDGDYERAEACYQLSLALNEALGAKARTGQSYADLAALHRAVGNRGAALRFHQMAIDTVTESPAAGPTWAPLLIQQQYKEALDHRDADGMEAAVARAKQLAGPLDPLGLSVHQLLVTVETDARVLIPLYRGIDARNAGNDAGAADAYEEALSKARAIDGPQGGYLSALVLATRRGPGDLERAASEFQSYLDAGGGSSGLTGQLLELMRAMSPDQAEKEARQAARRNADVAFAFFVRVEDFQRAKRYLDILAADAPRWWASDEQPWRPLSDIGAYYEGLEDYQRALEHYQLAIDELEARRGLLSRDELKTALSADLGVQYLYFQAARAGLRWAERSDEATRAELFARVFTFSERARARGLLDLLTGSIAASTGSHPADAASRRWRQLNARRQLKAGLLATARRERPDERERQDRLVAELEELDTEVAAAARAMAATSSAYARQAHGDDALASLADIVDMLDDETAVIQYMTLGEELLAWSITSDGMVAAPVASLRASDLAVQVRELHQDCHRDRDLAALVDRATTLSEILLRPLAGTLDRCERLIFVPYGELHVLPFAALRWDDDWLGAVRTLSVSPSASLLTIEREPLRSRPALVVGNPAGMAHRPPFAEKAQELPPLPFAETEATYIARKKLAVAPLLDKDATIGAVRDRLSDSAILVFSTHGVLYPEAPLMSGIALAHGEMLTVEDLSGERLDAGLVVLSACDTGRGDYLRGEEIVGLSRGLLAAGAGTAVVSLWPVSDRSTAVLMARFFDFLCDGQDAAVALRSAQAHVRKLDEVALSADFDDVRGVPSQAPPPTSGGAHPFKWASFLVVGSHSSFGANGVG